LTVNSREADPADWAATQTNLGNTLLGLGERGQAGALERAAAAYEAALTVFTRAADPFGWATTQYNIARLYRAMGRVADARAAALGSAEAFEALGETALAQRYPRAFLRRLPPE
jgi:tetratricopeptide (TPR) repeat protein